MSTFHLPRRVTRTAARLAVAVGLLSLPALASAQEIQERAAVLVQAPDQRRVLAALSVSLAGLQAYDTYSTLTVIKRGGRESNPLMQGLVGSPAAFIAVKAGITGVSIYQAERLWRQHHRGAAIALLAVTNGVMAVVAAHNASALKTGPVAAR